jgi:hypothetical protein
MRRIVAFALGFCLMVSPLSAWGAETRVYVSFSIGGAIALGGGLLLWNLHYVERLSKTAPEPPPEERLSRLAQTGSQEPRQVEPPRIGEEVALAPVSRVEVPLFRFQW